MLEIQTGRYEKKPRPERIGKRCWKLVFIRALGWRPCAYWICPWWVAETWSSDFTWKPGRTWTFKNCFRHLCKNSWTDKGGTKNVLELFSEIDTARYKRDFKRTLDKPEGARYVVKFAACLAVELVEAGERVFRRSLRSQMQNIFFPVSDESSDEVEIVRVSHAPGF